MPLIKICSLDEFVDAIKKSDEQFLKVNYYLLAYYDFRDEDGNSALHLAVQNGSKALVDIILDDGVDPNLTNNNKKTPLHLASENTDCPIIESLLKKGANPNACDARGETPLHEVCQKTIKDIQSVEILLKAGAKPTIRNHQGFSPLVVMFFIERIRRKEDVDHFCMIMKLLMQYGAKEKFRCEFGFDNFVCYGEPEHVEVLIKAGAYLESRCHKHTPLLRAASLGKADTAEVLLKSGANVHAITSDHSGHSALHLSAQEGDVDTVKVLLKYGANPNMLTSPLDSQFVQNRALLEIEFFAKAHNHNNETETPLHFAARAGQADIVELLVKAGAVVDKFARNGTPLFYAIRGADRMISFNKKSNYIKTVEILLSHGASIAAQDNSLWSQTSSLITPLELAKELLCSSTGHRETFEQIIDLIVHHQKTTVFSNTRT